MEAVERCPQLGDELEGDIDTLEGVLDRLATIVPRAVERRSAERIDACPSERVPIRDGEPQQVLHPLSLDLLVGIVMTKGERVSCLRPLEWNFGDVCKVLRHELSTRCLCVRTHWIRMSLTHSSE